MPKCGTRRRAAQCRRPLPGSAALVCSVCRSNPAPAPAPQSRGKASCSAFHAALWRLAQWPMPASHQGCAFGTEQTVVPACSAVLRLNRLRSLTVNAVADSVQQILRLCVGHPVAGGVRCPPPSRKGPAARAWRSSRLPEDHPRAVFAPLSQTGCISLRSPTSPTIPRPCSATGSPAMPSHRERAPLTCRPSRHCRSPAGPVSFLRQHPARPPTWFALTANPGQNCTCRPMAKPSGSSWIVSGVSRLCANHEESPPMAQPASTSLCQCAWFFTRAVPMYRGSASKA